MNLPTLAFKETNPVKKWEQELRSRGWRPDEPVTVYLIASDVGPDWKLYAITPSQDTADEMQKKFADTARAWKINGSLLMIEKIIRLDEVPQLFAFDKLFFV